MYWVRSKPPCFCQLRSNLEPWLQSIILRMWTLGPYGSWTGTLTVFFSDEQWILCMNTGCKMGGVSEYLGTSIVLVYTTRSRWWNWRWFRSCHESDPELTFWLSQGQRSNPPKFPIACCYSAMWNKLSSTSDVQRFLLQGKMGPDGADKSTTHPIVVNPFAHFQRLV